MQKWIAPVIIILVVAAGAYYEFLYPPTLLKRATDKSLRQFSDAVATKDRAKIGDALRALLSDDAKIKLEVNFFSITRDVPSMVQEFDKPTFITFIDNTLYPLTDYMYESALDSFALSDDRKTASVAFSSSEWADGTNYYGGTAIGVRFSADTDCTGQVVFTGGTPQLQNADCQVHLRTVPKPGEMEKIQKNPEIMQQFLTK